MNAKKKLIDLTCENPKCRKVFRAKFDHRRGHWPRFCSLACRDWQSNEERFWEQVDKNGPVHPILLTRCWIWKKGSSSSSGYGTFWVRPEGGSYKDGAILLAHRYSWTLHFGAIPKAEDHHGTLVVMHRCDNPLCVNPAHLTLGTQPENVADMVSKKRSHKRHGSQMPKAKLTEEAVIQIRQLRASGLSTADLAAKFGVNPTTVRRVLSGKLWSKA